MSLSYCDGFCLNSEARVHRPARGDWSRMLTATLSTAILPGGGDTPPTLEAELCLQHPVQDGPVKPSSIDPQPATQPIFSAELSPAGHR